MRDMTIGDVTRRTGIQASTIRYYEQIDLLPPATRVNGRRQYDGVVLDRLAVIRLAQEAGFTLAEVKQLVQGFGAAGSPRARWLPWALRKHGEVEALIKQARRMRRLLDALLACRCKRLEDCGRIACEYASKYQPYAPRENRSRGRSSRRGYAGRIR